MTKGYIFDYGGTLDTHGCHWGRVIWQAYQHGGVPVSETDFREAYVHAERTLGKNPIIQPDFTFRQTLETKLRLQLEFLQGRVGSSCVMTHLPTLTADLYEQTVGETAISRNVLLQLKDRYPLVLVSNFYGNINTILEDFRLDTYFRHVVESSVVGIRKPDPRIFMLGVEALQLEAEEVLVVGDSFSKDILPAHSMGCQTVWIRGKGWGDESVDESLPTFIIHGLEELTGVLKQIR